MVQLFQSSAPYYFYVFFKRYYISKRGNHEVYNNTLQSEPSNWLSQKNFGSKGNFLLDLIENWNDEFKELRATKLFEIYSNYAGGGER